MSISYNILPFTLFQENENDKMSIIIIFIPLFANILNLVSFNLIKRIYIIIIIIFCLFIDQPLVLQRVAATQRHTFNSKSPSTCPLQTPPPYEIEWHSQINCKY